MTENEKILADLLKDVYTWDELKPKLSEYNTIASETTTKNTRAGKLFEIFTKLCFLHDIEFSEEYNCKNIYLYEEIPVDLKSKLNLPKIEHGIDLLIVDHEDKIIAIQCKFKNDEKIKLNWNSDKLGNFFGFARKADLHCVFSNSSDIAEIAQNLTENFKFFSYSHLQNIKQETFEKIRNSLIGKPIKELKKPIPHDYQDEAILAVTNHFKENERAQLILPCGAGKTLTSLWIKEKLQSKNTLVLVPSLALLRQIKSTWNISYNIKFSRLNVCSEKDIDKDSDNDVAITHTYEIPGNVTSDKNEVALFLNKTGNKVIFSTYQSLQVVVDALQILPEFTFDLIIADEAHKTAGFTDQNKFTLVHNNQKLRADKRLYMTATPRIASPELKAKNSGRISFLKDMSNPKVYGKEAYRMTFGTAISKNILVNYKIIAVGVSDIDLKKNIEKNIQLTKSESIIDYAHNYALNIVMEKYKAFHALTFHSRIKKAVDFAERHNRLVPSTLSRSISGSQTTSEREIILKDFERADKAIVSNAKCLTEGVDVPVIDIVYYSDPKNSKIDIVQSAGRALRKAKHKNKEMGFIVVPIFHKDRETVEEAIEKSDFKNLISVIRSLCDQDERLVSEINELAWNKEKREKNGSSFDFTFSDEQTDKVIQFEQIKEKLKNSLFNQVIETLKDSWEIHFKEVEEYFIENGNSNIQARYKLPNGFGLGTWCVTQRVNYNKGLLSDNEIKKLQKLNFDFDPDQTLFENDFLELLKFKEENGHVNVPTMGNRLGIRINKLRNNYKKGTLNQDKIERLTNIGFQFIIKESFTWDEKFEELKNYYEKNNTNQVNSANELSLYNWERRQKSVIGKSKLNNNQIQKLESINFKWELKIDDWEENFKVFKVYWLQNKNFNFPKNHPEIKKLRKLIKDSRNSYRLKRNLNKLNQLSEIGFDINQFNTKEIKENEWNLYYTQLKYNFNNFGNLINELNSENHNLISWMNYQRRLYREQNLSIDKIKLLNQINFSWSTKIVREKIERPKEFIYEKKWLEKYENLKEYVELNNSFELPRNGEYKILHDWIITQRTKKNKGLLSEERIDLLEKINFPWFGQIGRKQIRELLTSKTQNSEKWDEKYKELMNYYLQNNSLILPFDEKYDVLRRWCLTQKIKFNKNILSEERYNKLNEIGFIWKEKRGKRKVKIEIEKISHNEQWNKKFEELQTFYRINEHYAIPLTEEHKKLILWIKTQRTFFAKNKLSTERIVKLNEINFPWTSKGKEFINPERNFHDDNWSKMYEEFRLIILTNKISTITRTNESTKKLAFWLSKQKKLFREGYMKIEHITKFDEINFDLTINKNSKSEEIWKNNYLALVKFQEVNGYCNPSTRKEDEKSLGTWVMFQRMNKRKGILEEYKINLLDEINFIWDPLKSNKNSKRNDEIWENKYKKLLDYKKLNNNTDVPQFNKEIGRWVNDQRVNYKKSKLTEYKINKLNEIGFNWNVKKKQNLI